MANNLYDQIAALPRGDARREEIAGALGCLHLSTAMLRISKIKDPAEMERVTRRVRSILDHDVPTNAS